MKLIKELDPDFINSIDKTKNIIICTPHECIIESETPDILSVVLNEDIDLSGSTIISPYLITIDYKPKIKISYPAGSKLNINEPESKEITGGIFNKIYSSYDLTYGYDEREIFNHFLVENINLTMYIDMIQMRKKFNGMYLKKNTPIAELMFVWYIQTKNNFPMIDEIYLIRDIEFYQEFIKTI